MTTAEEMVAVARVVEPRVVATAEETVAEARVAEAWAVARAEELAAEAKVVEAREVATSEETVAEARVAEAREVATAEETVAEARVAVVVVHRRRAREHWARRHVRHARRRPRPALDAWRVGLRRRSTADPAEEGARGGTECSGLTR